MDIYLVLVAVSVTAFVVGGVVVGGLWVTSRIVSDVAERAGSTVATTVGEAMRQVFGGVEPAEQLPGNVETPEEVRRFFPSHEVDDIFVPGSMDDIAGQEAGWLPGTPQGQQPQPRSDD